MPVQNSNPQTPPAKELQMEHDTICCETQSNGQLQALPSTPQDGAEAAAPSPPAFTRSPPPGTLNMNGLRAALPDIAFNSPSTNIIGTPFAHTTSNTPFEYPFPDTSPDNAPSSSPPHLYHRPGSPHGNFQPPPHPHTHSPNSGGFNLFHPKFKAPSPGSPPPVPPSLRKKRWTLNILSRKRTSNPPTPTTEYASPPLGSPPAVPSGAVIGGLGSGRPRLGDRPTCGGVRQCEDCGKILDK